MSFGTSSQREQGILTRLFIRVTVFVIRSMVVAQLVEEGEFDQRIEMILGVSCDL
jgi:hypothetical protein